MQANIARSGAGGGGSADKWELIETFTGEHITSSGGEHYVKVSEEPDGTPYNFKAVAVDMKATSAAYNDVKTNMFGVETPGGVVYVDNRSESFKTLGSSATKIAARASGLLIDQYYNSTGQHGDVTARSGNITGIILSFYGYSGMASPTNIQFKVYAVRA